MIKLCDKHYPKDGYYESIKLTSWGDCDQCRDGLFEKLSNIQISLNKIMGKIGAHEEEEQK